MERTSMARVPDGKRQVRHPAAGSRRRLPALYVLAGILVTAVILWLAHTGGAGAQTPDPAATVNGAPVSMAEFRAAMRKERAKVMGYFQAQYGAEDSAVFWGKRFGDGGGEVPLERLKQAALQRVVQDKVVQLLAVKAGALQDPGYGSYLKDLERENARRKKEADSGRPVYGPLQYEEGAYYEIRQSNIRSELLKKWGQEWQADPEETSRYYREHPEEFRKAGMIQAYKVTLPEALLLDMKDKLDTSGGNFEALAREACKDQPAEACGEVTFTAASARADSMLQPEAAAAAQQLEKGGISPVIKDRSGYSILKVLDKQGGDLVPLESVKAMIAEQLRNRAFEDWINRQIDEADVIKGKGLESISVKDLR
jgi:hypothetical protein